MQQRVQLHHTDHLTAFRVLGDGDRCVLLVHGWMTSSVVYTELASALSAAGYRVILPDLRGAGDSDDASSGYGLDAYVSDMRALLDHLNIEECTVVGHSMGGQIASLLCLEDPDRVTAQVLLCPVPASGLPLPDDALGLFRSASGNPQALGTILDIATVNLSDADKETLVTTATAISADCLQSSLDTWQAGGFAERLGDTRARTLVVASEDPFLPVPFLQEAVADRIPNAKLVVIPGAGHYVHVEQADATRDTLLGFLAS
jgi:pimeloyl-ACP methyl ester carboxylesterase